MKKFAIIFTVVTIVVFIAAIFISSFSNNYPLSTVVVNVNDKVVTVQDFNGNDWTFTDGQEDWTNGDICALIMNDNGTPNNIYDDKIVEKRYCGYIN